MTQGQKKTVPLAETAGRTIQGMRDGQKISHFQWHGYALIGIAALAHIFSQKSAAVKKNSMPPKAKDGSRQ